MNNNLFKCKHTYLFHIYIFVYGIKHESNTRTTTAAAANNVVNEPNIYTVPWWQRGANGFLRVGIINSYIIEIYYFPNSIISMYTHGLIIKHMH